MIKARGGAADGEKMPGKRAFGEADKHAEADFEDTQDAPSYAHEGRRCRN